MLRGE